MPIQAIKDAASTMRCEARWRTMKKFARYWIHNGLLTINSEKMAKSLGNFITIQDFLARYGDPDYLKLLFLNTHYRHPVDYTVEKIMEMKKEKERFVVLFDKINRVKGQGARSKEKQKQKDEILDDFKAKFEYAMDDDFNTPQALAVLFDLVTYTNKLMHGKETFTDSELSTVAGAAKLLSDLASVFAIDVTKNVPVPGAGIDEARIRACIDERVAARKAKDFKRGDDIREELLDLGIILEDTKDGTVWRRKL